VTAKAAVKSDRHAARHEAAHAVVAARLGLPLVYADIIEHGTGLTGFTSRSGRTKLGRGADANPTACAIVGAAGIVAEGEDRRRDFFISIDHPIAGDLLQLRRVAQRLGISADSDDDRFMSWARVVIQRARTLLRRDRGAAWRRVTTALLREHRLSGAIVYSLVRKKGTK